MLVSTGVVKLAPVNSGLPPVAAAYQRYVVTPGWLLLAVRVAVWPLLMVLPAAVGAARAGTNTTWADWVSVADEQKLASTLKVYASGAFTWAAI